MSTEAAPLVQRRRSVVLSAGEANAIVYAITLEIVDEAENLCSMPSSGCIADLLGISTRCARISRLTAINDQLVWRGDRDPADEPLSIVASDLLLLELVAILESTGRDCEEFPDEETERFSFDQAARAIRVSLAAQDAPAGPRLRRISAPGTRMSARRSRPRSR